MDVTSFVLDFYKTLLPSLILPFLIIVGLAVVSAVVKGLGARKRAERQVQRDIDELIYQKEIHRIAELEYRRIHSSRLDDIHRLDDK